MENSIDKRVEEFTRDIRWWNKQSNEFKSEYSGKWIAVGKKQVVASYSLENLGKLAKQAKIEISFTDYVEDHDECHAFSNAA